MATTTEKDSGKKKPLTLSRPGRLELNKTVEGGQVKQSFSHGRSKTVTVEVKKKRTFRQDAGGEMTEIKSQPDLIVEPAEAPVVPQVEEPVRETPPPARTLTEAEQATRVRVLEDARKAAEAARIEAEKRAVEEADRAASQPEPGPADEPEVVEEKPAAKTLDELRREEEEARRAVEEEAARAADEALQRANESARRRADAVADTPEAAEETPARGRGRGGAAGRPETRAAGAKPNTEQRRRRSGKLTISEALDEEGGARQRSVAAFRRRQERERQRVQRETGGAQAQQKIVREVQIPDTITVGELANRMAVRGNEVIKSLMKMDIMATTSQVIDQATAQLVAEEFGHAVKAVSASDVEIGLGGAIVDDEGVALPRAPVVTIMGHVDHGKTSLLDALRETNVVSGEAGGITQHIGAYQVEVPSGEKITFLDTPGHAAFTAMRQRGAHVTDLVILVVAADDSVQPQTVEAINHARAAGVPMIVAINKVDRREADPTRIKNELLNHEIVSEEMGGEVQCIEVSATEKIGLDALTEAIVLQAEILELKANPDRMAYGSIVEAKLEKGRGAVATVLIQGGTLKIGDIFVAGAEWGRVRAIIDDHGENIETAGPSMPVEVLGFNATPQAGDDFAVVDTEARAREIAEYRADVLKDQRATAGARGTLDEMFEQISAGEASLVPIVIKGDVQGSVEAIVGALDKMSTDEVKVQVLHSGVGGVNESDISLAAASGGIIIGFNVRAIPQARDQAKRDGVDIRYYNIIYNVVDDVKALLEGKLSPTLQENHLGNAEIREVFAVSKVGKVAGCMITSGTVKRGAKVRLLRDSVVVYEGDLAQLKRFKDDVREVQNGYECGMALENYNDIQVGDVIECYEVEEIARHLEAS
ncbi:MAG: translation initiation factor IF-2 [Alphaproteobacteria bacterium]|jgi:translation initiation factor IF-2